MITSAAPGSEIGEKERVTGITVHLTDLLDFQSLVGKRISVAGDDGSLRCVCQPADSVKPRGAAAAPRPPDVNGSLQMTHFIMI